MNDRVDSPSDSLERRPSGETRPRSVTGLLTLVLLLGAVLRLAYLTEIVREPDFKAPSLDALYHDYWARAMISGDWTPPEAMDDPLIRTTPYFRPPGYPWFLAAVYWFTGASYFWARVVQMAIGLVNCFLGFLLGRRLFGPRAGLLTAALMAVYWAFIYFEAEFLSPVLESFFCLILTLALLNWRASDFKTRWALAAGLILGAFALVRPNVLLLSLASCAWMGWLALERRAHRRFLWSAGALFAAMALTIAPVAVRNYRVSRDWVLISSNLGINLYANYNADAGPAYWPVRGLIDIVGATGWDCFSYPKLVRALERREGVPAGTLKHSQVSSLLSREAWRYILSHPGRSASLAFQRVLLFWGPAEVTNNKVVAIDRAHSVVLRLTLLQFPTILALAIIGTAVFIRRVSRQRRVANAAHDGDDEPWRVQRDGGILIWLLVAAYAASLFAAPVGSRFRVGLIPFLMVFGALALESLVSALGQRRLGRIVALAAAFAVLQYVVSRHYVAWQPNEASWYSMRANAFRAIGNYPEAIDNYARAVELDGSLQDARNNLGALLAASGRYAEAIRQYEAVLRAYPRGGAAHANLAMALDMVGRTDEAMSHFRAAIEVDPGNSSAWYNMAVMLSRLGRNDGALAAYAETIRLQPEFAQAHENMGALFASTGHLADAVEHFRRAAQASPRRAQAHANLAEALWQMGDSQTAEKEFRKSIELEPDHAIGYLRLGELLMSAPERSDEARQCLERALSIASDQDPPEVAARARECLDALAKSARSAPSAAR